MKKIIKKQTRTVWSVTLVTALCLLLFIPVFPGADRDTTTAGDGIGLYGAGPAIGGAYAAETGPAGEGGNAGTADGAEAAGPGAGKEGEEAASPAGGADGTEPGGDGAASPGEEGTPGIDIPGESPGETQDELPASEGGPDPEGTTGGGAPGQKQAPAGPSASAWISAQSLGIMPFAVDYAYFFHLTGQTDPFGSGHYYTQYYVPAGSDIPQLSFCLEMGKNAPPQNTPMTYSEMAAPGWSTALATYGPEILASHGISTTTDNAERYWAMQDAVWALTGSNIGAAANAPVVKALIEAASKPVASSNPVLNGVSDGGTLVAEVYDNDTVRYGPFSISGMDGVAEMRIFTANGSPCSDVRLCDASGATVPLSAVPGDTQLYFYLSRNLYLTQRINFEIKTSYALPVAMKAYQSSSSAYQNQLVMSSWDASSGSIAIGAKLGGFGECELTKLDAGWQTDYREAFYSEDSEGDAYRLEGAVFVVRQWNGGAFVDTGIPVTYNSKTRTYHSGFLAETAANQGRFQIYETNAPYGYRDPIVIEFNISGKYGLKLSGPPGKGEKNPSESAAAENSDGDGTFYALNDLLNVRIELQKRDSADKTPSFSGAANPQGGATLEGAYYGLFYGRNTTDPSGIRHTEGEIVCIGITGKNGKLVFDNSDAKAKAGDRRLIWSNSDSTTNYGTVDFPIYLPVFERQDRRIYPALYYIQELVPSSGYLLDIDPSTAELDANGVPLPGTGTARKYVADARDDGKASNPKGILIECTVKEDVKKRGFLLRKVKSSGYETEIYNLDGAGFSVYMVDDLVDIIKKAAAAGHSVKVPQRGPAGWDKQDFIDFFYDPDYEHPPASNSGKDWYNNETNVYKGRYNFELYPELKRARIDYVESPVFYSGAEPVPGLRYGDYGKKKPQAGEVVFPEFPYGEYIVFETYVPPGHERVKPFVVVIGEDGNDIEDGDGKYNIERPEQSWRIQIDSDMFSIRLWKKDAETGRVVIGKDAAYRLKYLGADGVEGGTDDRWVEMVVATPYGIVRWGTAENPFRVGVGGVLILPKKLQAGSYKLYEVEAPDGYVLSYHEAADNGGFYQAEEGQIHRHGYGEDEKTGDANFVEGHYILYTPVVDNSGEPSGGITSEPQPDAGIVFDLDEAHRVVDYDIDEDGYDDFVIELVQFNEQQKGRLNIHKEREIVTEQGERPDTAPLDGVKFELYAAENILSLDGHGAILYEEGELVGACITDADGNAYFKDLHLGRYTLKEADIDDSHKTTINGRLISGYSFVDQIEIDLTPPDGAGLQEDSPFWQENPVVSVSWNMLDTWRLGRIDVRKTGEKPKAPYVDERTGNIVFPYEEEPLEGVVFEIIAADDIVDSNTGETIWEKGDVVGTITTDEEGYGSLEDLLSGDYILRETSAPEGYIFVDDRPFTIKEREHTDPFEWYTWDITDARQKLSIVIEKIDEADGSKLAGAVFGLYAAEDIVVVAAGGAEGAEGPAPALPHFIPKAAAGPDDNPGEIGAPAWTPAIVIPAGTLIRTAVTGDDGKASFPDLIPGKYYVRELTPPHGYSPNEGFSPEVTLAFDGHLVEYLTWVGVCADKRAITVEVDKDTIKRTAAAFVSLPGQAGHNNVGKAEERYRYDIDFRSTAAIWADEFVVDDPLENVVKGKIIVEELWTPVVWGDFDGRWNLWYATNKTDKNRTYSDVSAMAGNPFNPENPDGIAVYPNTGLKLLAEGLRTDKRYHFKLKDFKLGKGEYLTHLRFEYGRVEVGFTSKNYADKSLNGEHRTFSGLDLKLPSKAANELMLLDPAAFGFTGQSAAAAGGPGAGEPDGAGGTGEPGDAPGGKNEKTIPIIGAETPENFDGAEDNYVTGIKGDVVDWTPREGTRFFASGAIDPGYELKPASYLVSAVKPMTDVDIVSSVSARIARDITMRAFDQDAVVTREIGTFAYSDSPAPAAPAAQNETSRPNEPTRGPAKTGDDNPLLIWILALLASSTGLLALGHFTITMRRKARRERV